MVAAQTVTDPMGAAWRAAWEPPDRRAIHDWASERVRLEGDYANTGNFKIGESRYLEFPFECLGDDRVRMLNVLKAPRTGGSLLGDVFLQYIVANRPGPTMCTFQSDDDGEQHFLTRIKPTFEATEINAPLFAQVRKKRDLYQFPHMNAYFQGANMNSLQRKSVKYEWNSEVWLWKPGFMQKAFNRTEDHKRTCKILNESQACALGTEWEINWNNGRRYNYGVRCFHCGKLQPFEFFAKMIDQGDIRAGIVWDATARNKDKSWNIPRAAETARFKCCHCGHEHADEQRTYERFASSAGYVCADPDRPFADVSVRWNALVGGDWGRLVKRFLQACEVRDLSGSTQLLEEFYIGPATLFWDPELVQQKITLRTSGYLLEEPFAEGYQAEKFPWELGRVIVADYQDGTGNDTRHLITNARAWGDRRARLLWEGRSNTFEDLYRLQLALDVPPQCVCIDGSWQMMEVAAQCVKYGWTMLIGDEPEYFLHKRKKGPPVRRPYSERFKVDPLKGKTGAGRRFCYAFRWSNPAFKQMVWNLRHGQTRTLWEVAGNVSPNYREAMDSNAKKRVASKQTGVARSIFVELIPNCHQWDDECMQAVVAAISGWLTFDIEDNERGEDAGGGDPARQRTAGAPTPPHDQPEQLELSVA